MTEACLDVPLYLRPEAKIEPLVARWYAWSHLISPVQAALNLVFRQVPLLRSFLANPAAHFAAGSDPQFFTGTFALLTEEDVGAVKALMSDVVRKHAQVIQFAMELKGFEQKFQAQATGGPLDQLYGLLPPSLAGAVELAYDSSGRPVMRIFEEMIYGSSRDLATAQQLSLFLGHDVDRPFFLNTPRLPSPERFDIDRPFADPRLDTLLRMRTYSSTLNELKRDLELAPDAVEKLGGFLTPEPPVRDMPNFNGPGVRVRSFGHACLLFQTRNVSVLLDPMVAQEHDTPEASLTMADLPDRIDYVFLTHNHQDHFCPEMLLQLRHRIGRILVPHHNPTNLADPSMSLALAALGFDNVSALDPLTRIPLADGRIVSLPFYGEHGDLDVHTKQGCFLELCGERFAILADSNCLDPALYRRVSERFGSIDVMFIGMECEGAPLSWLYGPYLAKTPSFRHDDGRRASGSNAERAWRAVQELGCRQVFVYAMGQEPWLRQHLGLAYTQESIQIIESDRFVARCREAGIAAARLHGCQEVRIEPRARGAAETEAARQPAVA